MDLVGAATATAAFSGVTNGAPVSVVASATPGVSAMSSGTMPAKASAALASGYHTSSSSSSFQALATSSSGRTSSSGSSSTSISGAVSGVSSAAAKIAKGKGQQYTARDLTMWGMTLKVMREEGGVKGLYRGLLTTAVGVAPYVGINFAAYEALRGWLTPPGKGSVGRKLSCGALAGACCC